MLAASNNNMLFVDLERFCDTDKNCSAVGTFNNSTVLSLPKLGAFCVFPYSSFIIGPNTCKFGMFGMQTLLEVPFGVRLCLIKKVNISLKIL
jgi:hypothetical protein